ncbi:MAG: prephenate dehydrogenase/arogenate dehydrogenase family protein [Armatimonadetes bacterium]|nr:prephenate dehydrogenase/arogenate dehydrogenase family protein [Armatimonadota bacterium]
MFHRVCIVGIGLIGGSFGLALKKHGLAREIVGVARRDSTLREALAIGACDAATSDVVEAATGADLVFLSPPVGQMKATCELIAPVVARGAIVTDAGSTKAQIVRECEPLFANARFVGGHPMAGSEKKGPQAARPDLFQGATWIVTPTTQTDANALSQLENLIETLGAKAIRLAPDAHDELLAVTSHVPHIAAAALVHSFLGSKSENPVASRLVAGGWRDGTRVAAGSPEMWRDISLANRDAIRAALGEMIGELTRVQTTLERRDEVALLRWFEIAAQERQKH